MMLVCSRVVERVVRWGARRMRTEVARERYMEEWIADLAYIPGSLAKLGYAFQIAVVAVPQLRWQQGRELQRVRVMRARADLAIEALRADMSPEAMYQAIADGVVSGLGFRSALLNLVRPDGDIEGAAASGSMTLQNALVGTVGRRAAYDRYLARCEHWGALRFIVNDTNAEGLPSFYSETPHDPDSNRWGPRHELTAPMYTPCGELIGSLAVDEPESGRLPDAVQRELLEVYAVKAAVAIINARAGGSGSEEVGS